MRIYNLEFASVRWEGHKVGIHLYLIRHGVGVIVSSTTVRRKRKCAAESSLHRLMYVARPRQVRDTDALFMRHESISARTQSCEVHDGHFGRDNNYPAGRLQDRREVPFGTTETAGWRPLSSSFRVLKSARPSHPEPSFDQRGIRSPAGRRNACIIHNQFPNPELEMNRRTGQLPPTPYPLLPSAFLVFL